MGEKGEEGEGGEGEGGRLRDKVTVKGYRKQLLKRDAVGATNAELNVDSVVVRQDLGGDEYQELFLR